MEQETRGRKTDGVRYGLVAVALFVVGGLAACSSSGTGASGGGSTPTVSTAQHAGLGMILVSGGKTLYTLAPSSTACDSACTNIWPELVLPSGVSAAAAGSGVSALNLGAVDRGGGLRQVTYSGKPLYFFSGDASAGQANGNLTDVWGKWSVVVIASPASAGMPTTPPTTSASPGAPATIGTVPPATSPPPATTPATTPPPAPTTTAPAGGGGVGF